MQNKYAQLLNNKMLQYGYIRHKDPSGEHMWKSQLDKLVILLDNDIQRAIMNEWHDLPTIGHPGRDETTRWVTKEYHWPEAKHWITEYIKGCSVCQQNKNLTYRPHIPQYKIPVPTDMKPFQHIAMDLITGLLKSQGHDAILTIVDHGCTRGAIFLPCITTIMGPQSAKLCLENVYWWFSLPQKIISD
jgi:hypothetical protein